AEATLFKNVVDRWDEAELSKLRTWRASRKLVDLHLIPVLGERQISSIEQDDVSDIIRLLAPGTARRLLALTRGVFDYACSPARHRTERLAVNPAANLNSTHFVGSPTRRQVVLSPAHLRYLWHATDQLPEPGGAYYRLLLLTACRKNEIALLRWDEVDFAEKVLLFQPRRMKSKRAWECPMSPAVAGILEALRNRYS